MSGGIGRMWGRMGAAGAEQDCRLNGGKGPKGPKRWCLM